MSIQGILFDKDGTLVDYTQTWVPTNRLVAQRIAGPNKDHVDTLLTAVGHDPTTDHVTPNSTIAAGTNRDVAAAWHPLVMKWGHSYTIENLASAIDAGFKEGVLKHLTPVCDLVELLTQLRQMGMKIGIATADSHAGALAFVNRLDLGLFFDFICGYDSGHGNKPTPGMVNAFCSAVSLPPHDIAMIGDSVHDLEMGRNAGVGLSVGVLTGACRESDLAPFADCVLSDVSLLPTLIEQLG